MQHFSELDRNAVSTQTTDQWLADYDAARAKTPEQYAAERQAQHLAAKSPTTAPVPTEPKNTAVTRQSVGDWLDGHQAAKSKSANECLDLINSLDSQFLPADCLVHGKTKIVRSQHGTGKSTAVRRLLPDAKSALIICAGITQAFQEHAKHPDFELYSDLAPGQIVADKVIVVIDSIQRVNRHFDLIVIDESEQIAAAGLKSNLHAVKGNPQGRVHFYHHLALVLSKTNKIILLDADAGALTETLCIYAGLDPILIDNGYKSLQGADVRLIKSRGAFLQAYEDHQGAHLFCSAPANAKAAHKRRKQKTTLIIGETGKVKKDFIHGVSTGQHFSGDLITTTALRSGVSIDEGNHDITAVFAWVKVGKGYPPLSDQLQAMRRVRGVKQFFIYVETGSAQAPLPVEPEHIRAELERSRSLSHKHVLPYLTSSPGKGVYFDEMTTDLYCLHQGELNRQRNDPSAWIVEAFENLGATITIDEADKPLLDKIQAKKQKQATEDVKAEALDKAATAAIPDNVDQCLDNVDKALFTARYVLDYAEPLARDAAKRDIEKTGFISSIQRMRRECRSQEVLAKEDAVKIASGDPVARCTAKAAAMTQEIISMCSHLIDGFTPADAEETLKPWIIRNVSDYGRVTGTRYICPEEVKSAGFLKRVLERYGLTVTFRKSGGQRVYSVDRNNVLNAMVLDELGQSCLNMFNSDNSALTADWGKVA